MSKAHMLLLARRNKKSVPHNCGTGLRSVASSESSAEHICEKMKGASGPPLMRLTVERNPSGFESFYFHTPSGNSSRLLNGVPSMEEWMGENEDFGIAMSLCKSHGFPKHRFRIQVCPISIGVYDELDPNHRKVFYALIQLFLEKHRSIVEDDRMMLPKSLNEHSV